MSTVLSYAEFQKHNFFRQPDWRWSRVLELCRRNPVGHCSKRDDRFVKQAKAFYQAYVRTEDAVDRTRLFWDEPGLYYAFELNDKATTDPEGAFYIQARLLARQTNAQIAKELSTIPETVEWYERLYFNVAEYLDCRDWITKQVLTPAIVRSQYVKVAPLPLDDDEDNKPQRSVLMRDNEIAHPFLDGSLKLLAYFGGNQVVDLMLHGMQTGKALQSMSDFSTWIDGHWKNVIRRRSLQAAATFEINRYNVMELFAIHTKIMELESSEEAQNANRSTHERHITALIDEIPWGTGAAGKKMIAGTVLGRLDERAGELRDDEVLRIAGGLTVPGLADDFPEELPPAKPRAGNAAANKVILQ